MQLKLNVILVIVIKSIALGQAHFADVFDAMVMAKKFSNFTCDNAKEINFVEVCDGEENCADGSDETGCDNKPVLFYHIFHRRNRDSAKSSCLHLISDNYDMTDYILCSYKKRFELNVTGVYLNDQKEFSITLLNEIVNLPHTSPADTELYPVSNIRVSSNGPQFYTLYMRQPDSADILKQVTRVGSVIQSTMNIRWNLKDMVFDSTTKHLYFISGSTIIVCDQNAVICGALLSKFINNPILLAISPKHRLLFWIEKLPTQEFCLYKSAIDMSSKPRVLSQNFQTPDWLTVDVIQERVYWVDDLSVHSIDFGGIDHEVPLMLPKAVSSLAAFNNAIYWSYKEKPQIWMCSVGDCAKPTLFREIERTDGTTFEVGSLTVDHRTLLTKIIQDPCTNSSCSHFCLLCKNTSFSCYCEGSDQPLSTNKNNGYCEDTTMIVGYQNYLYIYGFPHDLKLAPIINGNKINITSVSTVTYDSVKGNVILTETGLQKIYSWVPRTGDLILLSDDGFGSIRSIEFDDCAHNLYWVDPVSRVIRVMNLDTLLKLTILEGNPTYIPIELTLAPTKGYMFVQFLKNTSIIIIERIPMNGRRVGPPIHMDEEIDGEVSLHLHYRRETETLYLLDRQTNKIRYQLNEESGFRDITHSQTVSKMESFTTLDNAIFWLEDNMIYRGGIDGSSQMNIERKVPLGFKKNENGTLEMAPVERSALQSSFSQCLQNNGGCQELCLVSDETTKFACACTGNKILVNGSLCRDASVNVMNSTTRDENSMAETSVRLPKNGLNTDGASTTREEDVIHTRTHAAEHQQTKSTCIKSCPPIRDCSPCVPTSTDAALSTRNKSTGTCPVCPSSTSALSSDQSSTSSAFNWIFNSVVAILLGFVLGYVFRKYSSRSQHSFSIFHRPHATLELEQMRAESVMPLSSEVNDESVNEENENVQVTQAVKS